VKRDHPTFISEFSADTQAGSHIKLWGSTMREGKIPAGEVGV
jgi:hypothetical protein